MAEDGSAHMKSMLTNKILKSVGTSPAKLDAAVGQHRTLVETAALVRADVFDIEAGAAALEQLTARLSAIYSLIEPLLEESGPQALLARAIAQEIVPNPSAACTAVAEHLGGRRRGSTRTMLLGEALIYGHPDLRLVTHGDLNHVDEVLVFTRYAVHADSGQVIPLGADESVQDGARRAADHLETAVEPRAA
jgi:hypothetical protein